MLSSYRYRSIGDGRCLGTFANYLGHVRAACHAIGCDAPPVGHTAIRRSMIAIVKRGMYKERAKMFIDKCVPTYDVADRFVCQ